MVMLGGSGLKEELEEQPCRNKIEKAIGTNQSECTHSRCKPFKILK